MTNWKAQAEHGGAPRGDDEDGIGLAHGGQLPQSLGRRGFGGLNQGRGAAAAAHGDDAAAPKLGDGAIHRQQGDGFARGGHGNQFETVRHDGWPMEPEQPCRRTRRPAAGSHPSVISSNTVQPLETAPGGPVPGTPDNTRNDRPVEAPKPGDRAARRSAAGIPPMALYLEATRRLV